MNNVLYEANGKSISQSHIEEALFQAGVTEGDTIFVHSDITVFGKLVTRSRDMLLSAFVHALQKVVGVNGTVIMPTFTYSYCKNEVFDIQNSPSTVGVLTEHFRKSKNVSRTNHPIFSSAVWGNKQNFYLDTDMDSFGVHSIFSHLYKDSGKLVFLGTSLQACTYFHFIEQMYGVPYRYMKTFSGVTKNFDDLQENSCSFYVRNLEKNVVLDTTNIQNILLSEGLLTKTPLGNGNVLVISSDILYDRTCKLLSSDIFYLLKSPVQ